MLRHQEQVLLTGQVHSVVQEYPKINPDTLKVQLSMFRMKYSFRSSTDIVAIIQGMNPEVCVLCDQIETVACLLIAVPVSSDATQHHDPNPVGLCCVPCTQRKAGQG